MARQKQFRSSKLVRISYIRGRLPSVDNFKRPEPSIIARLLKRRLTTVNDLGAVGFVAKYQGERKGAFLSGNRLSLGASLNYRDEHYLLPGNGVISEHAIITFDDKGAILEAKDTMLFNGSQINEGHKRRLSKGTSITIGNNTLDFFFIRESEPAKPIEIRDGSPLLTILDVEDGKKSFAILSPNSRPFTIGSATNATLTLSMPNLSDICATIGYIRGGELVARDMQEGTRVDGLRMRGNDLKKLSRGSLIQIGKKFAILVDTIDGNLENTRVITNRSRSFASMEIITRMGGESAPGMKFLKDLARTEDFIYRSIQNSEQREIARVRWAAFNLLMFNRIAEKVRDPVDRKAEFIRFSRHISGFIKKMEPEKLPDFFHNMNLSRLCPDAIINLVYSTALLAPANLRPELSSIKPNKRLLNLFISAMRDESISSGARGIRSLISLIPDGLLDNPEKIPQDIGKGAVARKKALLDLNSVLIPHGIAITLTKDDHILIGQAVSYSFAGDLSVVHVRSLNVSGRFFVDEEFVESAGIMLPGMLQLPDDQGVLRNDKHNYHAVQHFIDEIAGYRSSVFAGMQAHTDQGRAEIEATAIAVELIMSNYSGSRILREIGKKRNGALGGGCRILQKEVGMGDPRGDLIRFVDHRYKDAGLSFSFTDIMNIGRQQAETTSKKS
jgi:hypothetical protein